MQYNYLNTQKLLRILMIKYFGDWRGKSRIVCGCFCAISLNLSIKSLKFEPIYVGTHEIPHSYENVLIGNILGIQYYANTIIHYSRG